MDLNRNNHFWLEWTGSNSDGGVPPHSVKLKDWSLTIRSFSVILKTLVLGSYSSAKVQSVYSTGPANRTCSYKNMFIRWWFIVPTQNIHRDRTIKSEKLDTKDGAKLMPSIYFLNQSIGMMVRVFANGLGDLGSIPRRVIPKTRKMLLDASWLNTRHYKVWIKDKVEQSKETSCTLPYTLV